MKLQKLGLDRKVEGSVELPRQFREEVRTEIIRRAVDALQSRRRQRYGAHPQAGKRQSGKLSRRRRDYKTSYGHGISRVPRKTLTHRGTRFNWVGAVAPGMVKGRRAHPPKSSKLWEQKINKKENRKAIRSAISASVVRDLVVGRGHIVPVEYPFIVDSAIEQLAKTADVQTALIAIGFGNEIERGAQKKIRAGRGKMRGRKYKRRKSLLIVVSDECPLLKSGNGIPGVDVASVNALNAELLAPGAVAGRAAIWTEKAVERIAREKMFL